MGCLYPAAESLYDLYVTRCTLLYKRKLHQVYFILPCFLRSENRKCRSIPVCYCRLFIYRPAHMSEPWRPLVQQRKADRCVYISVAHQWQISLNASNLPWKHYSFLFVPSYQTAKTQVFQLLCHYNHWASWAFIKIHLNKDWLV